MMGATGYRKSFLKMRLTRKVKRANFPQHLMKRSSGFTLIELLVVIAIIAILAVVVVLTLNPAELLRQSPVLRLRLWPKMN